MSNFSDQQPTQNLPDVSQISTTVAGDSTPMDNPMIKIEAFETPQKTVESTATSDQTAVSASATTWNNSAHINAQWSMNQDKNSWLGITGIGWKKLSTASESGIVALTMLGSHAKEKNSLVYYREESDSMTHELYVW